MSEELALPENFPHLDYHEAVMFRNFLRIVGELITCHANDQSGPVNTEELSREIQRQNKLDEKIVDMGHKPVRSTEEDKLRWALSLSPLILRVGYSKIRRTDCNEYQYGIVFSVYVQLYRDTTGLCDAIEHHARFAMKYEFNEKTRYTSKITVWEEPEERFDDSELKPHLYLPVAILLMDKVLEVLREEYIREREREEEEIGRRIDGRIGL